MNKGYGLTIVIVWNDRTALQYNILVGLAANSGHATFRPSWLNECSRHLVMRGSSISPDHCQCLKQLVRRKAQFDIWLKLLTPFQKPRRARLRSRDPRHLQDLRGDSGRLRLRDGVPGWGAGTAEAEGQEARPGMDPRWPREYRRSCWYICC